MTTDNFQNYDNNYFLQLMQNKKVCFSKWRWSSILLQQGVVSSCYRTTQDRFDATSLIDFHNMPTQLLTRQKMLNGEWPGHGCEYCKNIEDSKGVSDRMQYNMSSYKDNIPPELFVNNNEIKVTPTLVEVSLSNLCNMSCIYCGPLYSSVWEAEEEKYSNDRLRLKEDLFDTSTYSNVLEQFFIWLDKNLKHLKDLHILGGEPTHQPALYKLIDFLENNPNTNLDSLMIFTNLKISNEKLTQLCNRLTDLKNKGSIKYVVISASIDCWGQSQEYLRTGLDIIETENNLNYISSDHPNINLHIHGTITVLTIPTIEELLNKIIKLNITAEWSLVDFYDYLHPGIMPSGFYDKWFDRLIDISSRYSVKHDVTNKFISYKKYLNSTDANFEKILELKNYLTKLDQRRGTDWKTTFPWFFEFVNNIT